MSTITKLNPRVREARHRRAQLLRYYAMEAGLQSARSVAAIAAYAKLVELKYDSSRSGAQKDAIVERVQKEFALNVAKAELAVTAA